ncbi:hypothetical protein SK128_003497 [Halocaridina rubra]|uniref:Fatty acid hydroxylase domain-containing protein n=1 Tax=Halocaridina rubra TaxID=373956 RepID=A0AAN8XJ06_HALRR
MANTTIEEHENGITSEWVQRIGTLFYLVDPSKSTFKDPKEVPQYINEALPLFIALALLETAIRYLQGKKVRWNELFCSGGIGLLYMAIDFVCGAIMLLGYEWLYARRFLDLPWNSVYTWTGAFFLVDICYYWLHRAHHEVNILWAVHQVHHSGEDFNFGIPMRNSILQRAVSFGFYQPLALLGFPFPTILTHVALNFLFQFWVHTELISTVGPLEWIFNTPSHHRVHHGANKWCLDKNYGSVLIIWDRIFGTFQEEKHNEEIVYGLTSQPQSHNALWHQVFHFVDIYDKYKSMSTWTDKMKALFYGPGWFPGTHRLGDPDTFPDIKAPRAKYDPQLPKWQLVYIFTHLMLAGLVLYVFIIYRQDLSWSTVILCLVFFISSAGILTSMLDAWKWAPMMEASRCAMFIVAFTHLNPMANIPVANTAITGFFTISALFWISQSMGMDKVWVSLSLLNEYDM